MALLALVQNLITRLTGWVTYIATLPWIDLLAVSVSIDLISPSARVTSVKLPKRLGVSETTWHIDRTPGTPGSDKNVTSLTHKWDLVKLIYWQIGPLGPICHEETSAYALANWAPGPNFPLFRGRHTHTNRRAHMQHTQLCAQTNANTFTLSS